MDSSVRVAPLTALLFHVSPSHKEPCSATCGHSVVPYTWRAHFLDRVMTPSGPDRRAFFTAPMNTSVVVAAVAAVVVVAVVAVVVVSAVAAVVLAAAVAAVTSAKQMV